MVLIVFLLTIAALIAFELAWTHRGDWDRRRVVAVVVAGVGALAVAVATLPNFLYLGKVVGRLAMPVGLVWVALGAVVGLAWHRRERTYTIAASLVFVAYSLAGNPALGGAMIHWLESDFRQVDAFDGEPLDAVFLLGGGTARGRGGPPRMAAAGDRVLTAARVYRHRDVGVVVTSGSTIPGLGVQRDVAEEAAVILTELAVPAEAIVRLPDPKNSSQEVAAYSELSDERGWQRVGVVTSAWHLRRVMRLCDRAGLDAEPLPADFRGNLHWDGILSIIPDGGAFRNVQLASWEMLGAAVGR